jgi:hypothetical protein
VLREFDDSEYQGNQSTNEISDGRLMDDDVYKKRTFRGETERSNQTPSNLTHPAVKRESPILKPYSNNRMPTDLVLKKINFQWFELFDKYFHVRSVDTIEPFDRTVN